MIEELLRARLAQETKRPPALADELLREAAERYALARKRCPFEIGAMVTPRKDSDYQGAGDPHVVVEARGVEFPFFGPSSPSSNRSGLYLDIRVICFHDESIAAYWVESWHFEPWTRTAPAPAEPT